MRQDKYERLDAIKLIISNKEVSNQEELLNELARNGYVLTQATLSRDLKRLKVAKAASMSGRYVYVLPNNTMYKRTTEMQSIHEMMMHTGFVSIRFSGNLAVIKTRPGYASSLAYDIDNREIYEVLGTIAGDDTILLVMREDVDRAEVVEALSAVIPNINIQ
jgi:transcriptional regulator of arginine metabolism